MRKCCGAKCMVMLGVALLVVSQASEVSARRWERRWQRSCHPVAASEPCSKIGNCNCIRFVWWAYPAYYMYYTHDYYVPCDPSMDCDAYDPGLLAHPDELAAEDCPDCDQGKLTRIPNADYALERPFPQDYRVADNIAQGVTATVHEGLTKIGYVQTPLGRRLVKIFLVESRSATGEETGPLGFGVEVEGSVADPAFDKKATKHLNQPYLFEFRLGAVKYVVLLAK